MCKTQDFVHTHVHSHFSVGDALATPSELAMYARKNGYKAISLTDHGRMGGCVELYEACKKPVEELPTIKPIFGCCLPGQLIHTSSGVKPIQDIKVGDLVLTHRGRLRPVTNVMTRTYKGTLYGIKARQSNQVWLTDEHPIEVYTPADKQFHWVRADALCHGRPKNNQNKGLQNYVAYATFPIESGESDLTIDVLALLGETYHELSDCVARRKCYGKYDRDVQSDVPAKLPLTRELCRLLGLFVAEGSFLRDRKRRETGIRFTFNLASETHLANEVQVALAQIFHCPSTITRRPSKNSIEVYSCSTVLGRLFCELCGSGAKHKRIPSVIFRSSMEDCRAFIDGLSEGDGRIVPNTTQRILRMTSANVVYGARRLIARLNYFGKASTGVENGKTIHTLTWTEEAKYRRIDYRDGKVLMPIYGIDTKHYSGPVFNIEVEEDNSYVTDFSVHNCEVYVVKDRFDKTPIKDDNGRSRRPKTWHLTMLALNKVGYQNLLQLCHIGAKEGFYHNMRVDFDTIQQYSEGVVAMTGCLGSEVNQAIMRDDPEEAENVMRKYLEVFGDRYYGELQYHGIEAQKKCMPVVRDLCRKLGIPMIASNDVHYIEQADCDLHKVQINMRDIEDEGHKASGKESAYSTNNFHMRNQEEMQRMIGGLQDDAVRNTVLLAERVEDFFKVNVPHLIPHVNVPENDDNFISFKAKYYPYHTDEEALLAFHSVNGLYAKNLGGDATYRKRLQYELEVIMNMGVGEYFLIQRELVSFMRERDIEFGIRGSAVASLVNFCLGISSEDPIIGNLMFERFLNPGRGTQYSINFGISPSKKWMAENPNADQREATERLRDAARVALEKRPELAPLKARIGKELWVLENQGLASYICDIFDQGVRSDTNDAQLWVANLLGLTEEQPKGDMIVAQVATLPDVDTDVDDRERDTLINHAKELYGDDHVIMIGAWGTYQIKAAVTGCLKGSQRFRDTHGDNTHAEATRISKMIIKLPEDIEPTGCPLKDAGLANPDFEKMVRIWDSEMASAKRLVGRISHLGVHAAGVIICREPVYLHSPIEKSNKGLCTAYDMGTIEKLGLVKWDFLGLAMYQKIARCRKMIKERHGVNINLYALPFDDRKTLKLFSDCKTASLFQFGGGGMQSSLRLVKADNLEDLVAIVALYRPGPKAFIPDYATRKKNPAAVAYPHPVIRQHLGVTYNIPVYQEQVMMVCKDMALFTWPEVDKMRKAVSKKDDDIFRKVCALFKEKSVNNGVAPVIVDDILSSWQAFSGYAFNRAHAYSYAVLAYRTGYLRAHYPREWLAACMQTDQEKDDRMEAHQKEAWSENIPVRSADVNESKEEIGITTKGAIIKPLTSLKGIGGQASAVIAKQPYTDLRDLIVKAGPNRGVIKTLAEFHALNSLPEGGRTVEEILALADEIVSDIKSAKKQAAKEEQRGYKTVDPFAAFTRAPSTATVAPSSKGGLAQGDGFFD